jgi:hypothetical protein
MAEMVASAAASAMGSFIGKLAAMLGENYQLAGKVRRGIRSLKDELSTMDAVLQELAEKDDDQIDGQTKDWRNKVRELSLDIEDCIDRFMLNRSHGGSKANCVRKAVRKVKILLQDRGLAEEIQELKSLAIEQSERAKRYDIHQCQCLAASTRHRQVCLDPRAPALFQEEGSRGDGWSSRGDHGVAESWRREAAQGGVHLWNRWAGEDHSRHGGVPQNLRTI